jgi:predicted ATP-grasp superfamily ATP-dependent carboligase
MPNTITPVVVLRAINHGGLGIARSLGRLGIPVYAADTSSTVPVAFSRYCRGFFKWNFETAPPEQTLDYLLGCGRKLGKRPILIPTTDETALFVSDNAYALKEGFDFPDQSSRTVHTLANKHSMFRAAKELGIPTPETVLPANRGDVVSFANTATFPVVMKLLDSHYAGGQRTHGTYIAVTRGELLERFDRLQDAQSTPVILQEYIPGGDDTIWMFNGYFNARGECLFGMTGQKLRQCPVYTGAASLAVCRGNVEVYDATLAFMKAVGYRGILDIGYRFDARDGKYKVLDANPRIGCSFRLFVGRDGMDVARALYFDLTGQSVAPSAACEGRKWLVEDCDLVSSIRYYFDGKVKIAEWIRSFRGVRETAFFSVRDPVPMLAAFISDLRRLPRRIRQTDAGEKKSTPETGVALQSGHTSAVDH